MNLLPAPQPAAAERPSCTARLADPRRLASLLLLALLLGCGERSGSRAAGALPLVAPSDLRVLYGLGPPVPRGHPLHGKLVVLLDARGQAEYDAGHLRTARHFEASASFGPTGVGKDGCVIVYAGSDAEAAETAALLRERGWQQVFLLEGGLAGAKAIGLPVDATPPPGAAAGEQTPPPKVEGSAVATADATHITGAEVAGKPAVRLLVTAALRGVLEGCGCGASGLGVARIATLLRGLRVEGVPTLVLDAGELFTGTEELDRRRSLHFLGIMKSLGFEASVVGSDAGRFGAEFVRSRLAGAPVPLVSANLAIAGARPFAAHRTLEVAGRRIALVGVSIPSAPDPHPEHREGPGRRQAGMRLPAEDEVPEINLERAVESLTPVLAERKAQADLVVVAGNIPLELAEELSRLPDAPSLILSGAPLLKPSGRLIGGKVARPGGQENMIMVHDLRVKTGATQVFFLGGTAASSVHWIDLVWTGDKALADPGYGLALGTLEHTAKDPAVDAQVQALFEEVRRDPELQKRLPQRLAGLELESDPGNAYVGQEACTKCHEKETEHWKRTPHSLAYKVLEKVDRAYYPSCVSCHTTGAGHPKGYKTGEKALEILQGVQCETCHGPGAKHVADPENKSVTRRAAGRDLCIRCHDGVEGEGFPSEELFGLAHKFMSHLDPGTEYFQRKAARGK